MYPSHHHAAERGHYDMTASADLVRFNRILHVLLASFSWRLKLFPKRQID